MNEKNTELANRWTIELLWWAMSLIICIFVIFPIWHKLPDFPYLTYNILYTLIFFNGMRYLFMLEKTPFSHNIVFKLVLIFITIPSLVYQIDWINMFQDFKDEGILLQLAEELPFAEQKGILKYIANEFIFFGVGSILTSMLLPFRMLISIWRVRNRGTV